MKKKIIKPNETYTILDIVKSGFFLPYVKSYPGVRNMVLKDRASKNLLKASVYGQGQGRRYYILGKNIITFLANWEDGSYQL